MRRSCSCTPAERSSRVASARFRNPACRGRSSRGIRLQRTGNSEVGCGNQRRSVAQLRRQRRGRTAPTARRTRRLPKLAVPTIPGPRDGLRKLGVARPLAIDIRLARGLHARHRRLATSVPPWLVPRAPSAGAPSADVPSANLLSDSIPGSHPSHRPWGGRTRRSGFRPCRCCGTRILHGRECRAMPRPLLRPKLASPAWPPPTTDLADPAQAGLTASTRPPGVLPAELARPSRGLRVVRENDSCSPLRRITPAAPPPRAAAISASLSMPCCHAGTSDGTTSHHATPPATNSPRHPVAASKLPPVRPTPNAAWY